MQIKLNNKLYYYTCVILLRVHTPHLSMPEAVLGGFL